MIRIEGTEVNGWEAAVRGMRNPMNSWEKSDSWWASADECYAEAPMYIVGDEDMKLMRSLVKAGTDHRKFLRFIIVTADITAPLYWWKEYDTYKVGTVANSCSTIHKVHAKKFELDDFSHEHLNGCSITVLKDVIAQLNRCRNTYNVTKDKDDWWQMIQLLPSSYNQRRTVLLNYEVLANIYRARRAHKLDEWRVFCGWIEALPYAELITGGHADADSGD